MKTILHYLFLFTMLIGNLLAQGTAVEVDSVTAGRAFARNMWNQYRFYGTFDVDNNGEYRSISGTMDLRGQITRFVVDDTVLVGTGDEPLPGLPYVETGTITHFWISLDAMSGENEVAWGYTSATRLEEGDSITITLFPADQRGFVSYSAGGEDLQLVDGNGFEVGYYNPYNNGFFYYIDPLKGAFYAYITSGGRRVGVVLLDPFEIPETLNNNAVNFELTGNVVRVIKNENDYANFSAQTDGQTEVNGTSCPAKVFIMDAEGYEHHLTIRTEFGEDVVASVYDISKNQFKLIQDVGFWSTDWYSYGEFQLPKGYGKIMVVVSSKTKDEKSFRAFFTRGIGGKG